MNYYGKTKRKKQQYTFVVFQIFLIGLFIFLTSLGIKVQASDVPVKPSPGIYVVDQTNTLSTSRQQWLNALATEVDKKTKAQLAILVVKSTDGEDISEYGLKVLRTWGIGQSKENTGMLLLVALDDKKIRIEVGYGLEGIMNDAKAGQILDTYAIPNFKENQYETGIVKTYVAIAQVVAKAYNVELTNPSNTNNQENSGVTEESTFSTWQEILFGGFLIFLIIIDQLFLGGRFTYLLIMLLFRGGGRGGGGSGNNRGGGFGGGSGGGGGASRGW